MVGDVGGVLTCCPVLHVIYSIRAAKLQCQTLLRWSGSHLWRKLMTSRSPVDLTLYLEACLFFFYFPHSPLVFFCLFVCFFFLPPAAFKPFSKNWSSILYEHGKHRFFCFHPPEYYSVFASDCRQLRVALFFFFFFLVLEKEFKNSSCCRRKMR